MSWKRVTITIFLVIIFLNILQINIFLIYIYLSEPASEDLSREIIPYIWYGETLLGMGLALVFIYNYLKTTKKRKMALAYEETGTKPKGEVDITPSIGYNGASLFYEVMIDNRTAFPIGDVIIKPYLSNEIFTLEKDEESIPVIRPYDSTTVKFGVIPKQEEQGEADVLGRVNYYNPGIDDYEEHLLKPKAIKIMWPVLKGVEIENEYWENITSTLRKAEEDIPDIPLSGEKCKDFTTDIVQDKMFNVSSGVLDGETYTATTKFYALDEEGLKVGVELIVTAKSKDELPSQLKIVVYAENRESLVGLYYFIFYDIYKGLEEVEGELARLEEAEKVIAEPKILLPPEMSAQAMGAEGPTRDLYEEFDRLRGRVETIEKDKIGVDAKFRSLYELDELYKILAEDLVKRKIVDIKAGEEIVKKRLAKKQLEELKRFEEAYALLCEAETSDSVLTRKDFPESGKKAILLVYFNAVEVYVRERLKELLPKGVTILLGENHGHINTRKKDWEKNWAVLSLGSCIHIINHNSYLFLKDEELWKQKVETLMHQVREMRNTVAHPSKENPEPKLVREKVYKLLKELPEVLKSKE